MSNPTFGVIWDRIVAHQGETFLTKKCLKFTYVVNGNVLSPSRTKYKISTGDFEKAYGMVPISGPGVINEIVRGPSYIWAVLHDQRISMGQW
jgi:hypothetical protein